MNALQARMRTLVVLAIVGTIFTAAAAGCSSRPAAPSADDQKAACFENIARIKQTMDLFYEDSQTYPPVNIVVEKLHLVCPSGGTYSAAADTDAVVCSVHGSP